MMKKRYYYTLLLSLFLLLGGCGNKKKTKQRALAETSIQVAVDETFEPIVDAELFIFGNVFPKIKTEAIYRPEKKVLDLLLNDSVKLAVLSREFNEQETKTFARRKIKIRSTRFAVDGIALVVNRASADSTITVNEIVDILRGVQTGLLVFDNQNSSTVRYLMDLADVNALPAKGIYALKSNRDVIRYVYDNPGTIGVVGINWIQQPDADLAKYVDGLKVMGVKNIKGKPGSDRYYKPNQNNLALGTYPLTRNVYIVDCSGGKAAANTLASFLAGEQGQRIVLKSGLLPDSIPPRQIIINKEKIKYK